MTGPTNCPHCGVSLIGDPIPENIRHHFFEEANFKRERVVEYPPRNFGVWVFECPDCFKRWRMIDGRCDIILGELSDS